MAKNMQKLGSDSNFRRVHRACDALNWGQIPIICESEGAKGGCRELRPAAHLLFLSRQEKKAKKATLLSASLCA